LARDIISGKKNIVKIYDIQADDSEADKKRVLHLDPGFLICIASD